MEKEKELVKIDTEWLEANGYTVDDIQTGDVLIWGLNQKGYIVYFKKEEEFIANPRDGLDAFRIFRVKIDRTFPFVFLQILRRLT